MSDDDAMDEQEQPTVTISGDITEVNGVSIDFLSGEKQVIASCEMLPPNGAYTLNDVPSQYEHVWIYDNYGRGKLLSKNDFTVAQSSIGIQDAELQMIKVRVFGDEAHTMPLPNVNVFWLVLVQMWLHGLPMEAVLQSSEFQVANTRSSRQEHMLVKGLMLM